MQDSEKRYSVADQNRDILKKSVWKILSLYGCAAEDFIFKSAN